MKESRWESKAVVRYGPFATTSSAAHCSRAHNTEREEREEREEHKAEDGQAQALARHGYRALGGRKDLTHMTTDRCHPAGLCAAPEQREEEEEEEEEGPWLRREVGGRPCSPLASDTSRPICRKRPVSLSLFLSGSLRPLLLRWLLLLHSRTGQRGGTLAAYRGALIGMAVLAPVCYGPVLACLRFLLSGLPLPLAP